MNYKRLLSALLCVFFLSVPQIAMTAFASDIEADMSKAVDEAAGKVDGDLSKMDADQEKALADKLAEFAEKDEAAVSQFMKDNAKLKSMNSEMKARLDTTFTKEEAAIQEAAASEEGAANLFDNAGGTEGMSEKEGIEALRNTRKTRNMLRTVKEDFKNKCITASEDGMRSLAKAVKDYPTNAELADAYLIKVGKGKLGNIRATIPDNAFKSGLLGDGVTADSLAQDINTALAKGDRAALIKACAKVARAEALGAVGDISDKIAGFEKGSLGGSYKAIEGVGQNLLEGSISKLDKTWDTFADDAAAKKNWDEVVKPGEKTPGEVGAKGIATSGEEGASVTAIDQFINEQFGALDKEIGSTYDDMMGKLDATDATIAKNSGIKLDSYVTKLKTTEFFRNPLDVFKESLEAFKTALKRTNIRDLADGAAESIGGKLRSLKSKLGMAVETLFSAVLFMIPNIFQSAYLAQQEKAAQLSTWAKPIEYAGKVWQVPDWCINLDNPTDSIPLYVQIPVNSVGDEINATLATKFGNTINQGTPTSNNPISAAIHNVSSDIWSFGSTLETKIKRYIFTNDFLTHTDVAVMYGSPDSMAPTGTVNIGGSEFTGQLVSLKTGQVIDGSGETVDATGLPQIKGIPLISGNTSFSMWGTLPLGQTPAAQGGLKPLAHTYATLIEKMETLGIKVSFTQYSDMGSGSSGTNVGKSSAEYFDTSCIDEETGALKSSTCHCLLKEGLKDLTNGLELDANGEVTTTTVAQSGTTWQGLGTVKPILGWGTDKFTQIIDIGSAGVFSGFDPSKVSFSGAEKVQAAGTEQETTTVQQYADPDTVWAAQGCWIYLCADTPFIKELQANAPASACSTNSSLTDYIVFMDESLNIVPLMVPVTVTKTYTETSATPTPPLSSAQATPASSKAISSDAAGTSYTYQTSELSLNPAIKHWTSLVFYNQPYFVQADKQGNVNPIMYDLKGGKYLDAGLGSLAGTKKPAGAIPTYLYATGQGVVSIAQTYPDIFNQLEMHKAALLYKLQELDMTIGGTLFTASDYVLNIQGQSLPTYTSKTLNCFGTSNQQDLFVALDNNGNPIGLPSSTVSYMQSLVTDVVYQLDTTTNTWSPAGSYPNIAVNPPTGTGFGLSPLKLGADKQPVKKSDGSYQVAQGMDSYLQNLGNWLQITNPTLDGTLTTASQYSNPLTINTTEKNDTADAIIITANEKIISYVQKQRLKWLAALDDVVELGTGGDAVLANIANTLTRAYAKSNKCYVYEMSPSPSILYANSDYFVVVNSSLPTLTTLTQPADLKKIAQGSKATIVSLLTGTMYSLEGQPLFDKSGNPKIISIPSNVYASGKTTTEIIYDAFTGKFGSLPTSFKQSYKAMVDSYAKSQMIPKGPYSFGKYKVSIRTADYVAGQNSANNNYVYFDAAQMTKSTIVPTDMYVIVDADLNPDVYNPAKKQLLVSLITGIAVDQQGDIANKLPASNLNSIISTLQGGWSEWVKQNVKRLQTAHKQHENQMKQDQQNLEDRLAAFAKQYDAAENKDQAAIVQVIKNLQPAGAGLPVPYAGLEYDKTMGNYVHPTPLNDKGELLYLFMGTGKVYGQQGNYHSRYQAQHIAAVRDEYGVVVNPKTGKQKLGVPMMQPSLIMDPQDLEITVGKSGASLIASGSEEFPGEIIAMPKGYGLYFSKIMDTYYVLDSKNDRWMSVDGGHVYQKNGQPVIDKNSVAMSTDGVPLLLYKNKDGFMQAYMTDGADYANISESNEAMTWLGLPPSFNQYSVTTNATSAEAIPTKYIVENSSKSSTTYTVSKNYAWQMLVLVPIDTTGKLLKNIPDSSYQYLQLVENKNGELTHVVYNGTAYKASVSASGETTAGATYKFEPIELTETSVKSISITANMTDADTTAPYIVVSDGTNKYMYAYVPKSYTSEEQETNRAEIIGGVTSPSPLPIAVGPMHPVSEDRVVPDYITHVLFEADLPSNKGVIIQPKPVAAASVYNVPTENPEAEEFAYKFNGSVYQTTDNRFVYKIAGSVSQATPATLTFDYIAKDAYVDLKTAAVYDAKTGQALGQCLNMNDFLKVLDACSVNVSNKTLEIKNNKGKVTKSINKKGNNMLVYRSVQTAQKQEETIESQTAMAGNQA